MIEDKNFKSPCIGYVKSSEKIEGITIDCLEVASIYDVLPEIVKIAEFGKEYNIRCTLNQIKITRLNN